MGAKGTGGDGREWGASTKQVIDAIQGDCRSLREIANYTGIPYRSVNAIVNSLEMQDRVVAENYDLKRGEQRFKVLRADKHPVRNRGFVEHPRKRSVPPMAAQVQGLFGMGMTPATVAQATGVGRVHRLV